VAEEIKKKKSLKRLVAVWPEVWALVRPRMWLLVGGFFLMVINRVADWCFVVTQGAFGRRDRKASICAVAMVDLGCARRHGCARRDVVCIDATALKGRAAGHR